MKQKDLLLENFKNTEFDFGQQILNYMSSKTDAGEVFAPYIPFVGEQYEHFKILAYATAQNIGFDSATRKIYIANNSKLTERLYYFDGFTKKYPADKMPFYKIDISPYQNGVMAALLGVFIYALSGKVVKDLDEINDLIAVSNYYKFSLNSGNADINPETNGKHKITAYIEDKAQIQQYWAVNDKLVKKEIEILKPQFVLSFKGRKLNQLKALAGNSFTVIPVNDPAWILNGHGGHLSPGGSWQRFVAGRKNKALDDLVAHYLDYMSWRYASKKEAIGVYLKKYYYDWERIKQ